MWQIYISPIIPAAFFITATDSLLSFQNTLTCATFVMHDSYGFVLHLVTKRLEVNKYVQF